MKKTFLKEFFKKINIVFSLALILTALSLSISAQQVTSVYLYDENGRLSSVIYPNGDAVVYEYDAAGNFTAINRFPSNELRIVAFTPRRGPVGTNVTIYGTGFSNGITAVAFNGANAQIIQTNPSSIVAKVPLNATSGPISVFTNTGSAVSVNPFIVRGVLVTPRSLTISANDSVPFDVNVSGLPTTNVNWSVNGIVGGNVSVGTVSTNGIYTAPNLVNSAPMQYLVRATSDDDSTLFDEAVVNVLSVGAGFQFRTDGVSVRYGTSPNTPPAYVQNGVSVRYGTPTNTPPVFAQDGVSVRYGTPPNTPSVFAQDGVSVGMGPFLSTLAPITLTRGTSITVNVTGILLNGATNVSFYRVSSGTLEAGITASNIVVNGQGTALSSTVAVAGNVAVGSFVVVVTTPAGSTVRSPGIGNVIQVQ